MMGTLDDYLALPQYEVRYYQIFQKQWVSDIYPGPYQDIKSFLENLESCGVIRNYSIKEAVVL